MFPTPYPNEDFRSLIYRYHYYTLGSEYSKTIYQLFNIKTLKVRHLPRNINYLVSQLSSSINADYLLKETTVINVIRGFCGEEMMRKVVDDINNGKEKHKISAAGILSGSSEGGIFNEHYRYCIQCLLSDYETYGECYLHKYHQFRYLDVCYKHQSLLITHCPECNELLTKSTGENQLNKPQCPNGCSLFRNIFNEVKEKEIKVNLLSDLIFLSEGDSSLKTFELSHKFITCLGEKGYIHPSGIINKQKMLREFIAFYPEGVLEGYGLPSVVFKRRTVKRLFNPHFMHLFIPLYILLFRFLAGSAKSFLQKEFIYCNDLPFGPGLWDCHNPNCLFYKQKSIQKYRRIQRHGYISGEFKCNECGYTYIRKKKYKNNEQEETFFIVTTGDQMREQVAQLINQDNTLKDIARVLRISEKTVKKLSLYSNTSDNLNRSISSLGLQKRDRYREQVIYLLNQSQELSRTELKQIKPVPYNWLSKYDQVWFNKHMPQVKKGGNATLNFKQIDLELCNKVRAIAKDVYHEDPSKQIKPYTLLFRLSKRDYGRFHANKSKLPLTWSVAQECAEGKLDYLLRDLPRFVVSLRMNGLKRITFNSLKSRRGYANCNDEERFRIEEKLMELELLSDL